MAASFPEDSKLPLYAVSASPEGLVDADGLAYFVRVTPVQTVSWARASGP